MKNMMMLLISLLSFSISGQQIIQAFEIEGEDAIFVVKDSNGYFVTLDPKHRINGLFTSNSKVSLRDVSLNCAKDTCAIIFSYDYDGSIYFKSYSRESNSNKWSTLHRSGRLYFPFSAKPAEWINIPSSWSIETFEVVRLHYRNREDQFMYFECAGSIITQKIVDNLDEVPVRN